MKTMRGLVVAALAFGWAGAAWAEDPIGHWTGMLTVQGGEKIAVGIKISKGADGKLAGVGESAQSPDPIPMEDVISDGSKLSVKSAALQGVYEGTWDAASKSWKGMWTQAGQAQPLILSRKN